MVAGPDSHPDPAPGETSAEADGATPGEAKWSVMRELERRFPGITAESVSFEVVEEGGGGRARVRGTIDVEAWRAEADEELPDEPAERLRALVTRVVQALGLRATVDVEESAEEIRATVNGEELGLLIGRHGSTIDALQHLAMRAALRGGDERKRVVVDAAGYRERREAALERSADKAVSDALRLGRPVELEPMTAPERKVVHMYLRERTEVETHSEGDEPDRRLVVTPVRVDGR